MPRPRRARLDLPGGPRVSSHCAAVTRKPRPRGLNTTDACPSPCQGPARGSPAGLLQQGPGDPGAWGAENSHRLRLPRTGSDLEKRGASTVSGRLGKGETARREEAALARGAGPAGPTALGRESPHAKARRPETGGEAPKSGPSQPHPGYAQGGGRLPGEPAPDWRFGPFSPVPNHPGREGLEADSMADGQRLIDWADVTRPP